METLVLFDYEGAWGMPHALTYDLDRATEDILGVLSRRDVHALFFVVGRIILEQPRLVERIAGAGHEIGLHGYRHERLDTLTPHALSTLRCELEEACRAVEQVTGRRPTGFRAPYLLAPRFHDEAVARVLLEAGFRWTSNRELRFPEELLRPDRVPWRRAADVLRRLGLSDPGRPLGHLAFLALNAAVLRRDPTFTSVRQVLRWLDGPRPPLEREGLFDVPVAAPLDCDLLGTPRPDEDTPTAWLDYAASCLTEGAGRHGGPYAVTFHDWIVATGNRLRLLETTLDTLARTTGFIDARGWTPDADRRPGLPSLAGIPSRPRASRVER